MSQRSRRLPRAQVKSLDELSALPKSAPWLLTERLVVKPDQLIKRRGKNGLVKLGVDWAGAQAVCAEWMGRQIEIEGAPGGLIGVADEAATALE